MPYPVICKFLEEQALLFVCGSLPEEQRQPFELLLNAMKTCAILRRLIRGIRSSLVR
jgi:hypothetical protein